jgi:hypothetical protein
VAIQRGGVTVETFADLGKTVLRRPPRLGSVRLVAVDGPGGAGKSLFAGRLAISEPSHESAAPVTSLHAAG